MTQQRHKAARNTLLICLVFFWVSNTAHAHEGSLGNEVMWQACDNHKINADCWFQSIDHDIFRGTCQSMSNALVCVRNQPIQRATNWSDSHQHEPQSDSTKLVRWLVAAFFVLLVGGLIIFKKQSVSR